MFVYGIVVFLIFGLVTDVASTVMKTQVNDKLPEGERFSWWARNYSAVGRKYREFYPDSLLPDLARYSGWVCLFLLVAAVLSSFLQS